MSDEPGAGASLAPGSVGSSEVVGGPDSTGVPVSTGVLDSTGVPVSTGVPDSTGSPEALGSSCRLPNFVSEGASEVGVPEGPPSTIPLKPPSPRKWDGPSWLCPPKLP